MFRHYCVILRELVVSTLPSYTSMSNAVVGYTGWAKSTYTVYYILYIYFWPTLYNIKFKIILHRFYVVEISVFKIFKTLRFMFIMKWATIILLLVFLNKVLTTKSLRKTR